MKPRGRGPAPGRRALPLAIAASVAALGGAALVYYLLGPGTAPGARSPFFAPARGPKAEALRREIAAAARPTGQRILLIGWDAADWQIAEPLLREGKLPTLRRLIDGGAVAQVRSLMPMLSPLLWTSVATGRRPSEHGILDFLVLDPQTAQLAPMSSTHRRAMALWNMLSEAGRKSAFVAWWATWPAEPIDGVMVSDRVAYSLLAEVATSAPLAGATWPEVYHLRTEAHWVVPPAISDAQLARFIDLPPAAIAVERARPERANPVAQLAQILASTRNYQAIGLDLVRQRAFDLVSVYFEGIDQVGHLFQHMMPPKMALASDEEFRRYRGVVPRFYEHLDRLTGELIAAAPAGTTVILLSDHGFKNGSGRPTDFPPFLTGRPAHWHRQYGMFVAAGPRIRKGVGIDTVSLLDLAPTLLYLLGLPLGRDLPGKVLSEAIEPDFLRELPPRWIASWEPLRLQPRRAAGRSAADSEMMKNLVALGYIGGKATEGGAAETAAYHRNLANVLLREGRLEQAERAVRRSLAAGATYEAYELLFEIAKARGKTAEAAAALEQGIELFTDIPGTTFLKLVDLYLAGRQVAQARAVLERHHARIPSECFLLQAEAMVEEAEGRVAAAERHYHRALQLDPTFAFALESLYRIYRGTGRLERLESTVRAGLEKNPQLALYHNVQGVLYKRRGQLREAVAAYERALELDPENSTFRANLAAATLSLGQPQRALELLLQARAKNERDPEVWVNLGAVYGTLGRNDEGLTAFQRAVELSADSARVQLGLAAIHAQKGEIAEATRIARAALLKYPGHPDLTELLRALQQEGS